MQQHDVYSVHKHNNVTATGLTMTTESNYWLSHKLLNYGHTTCQASQLTNEHTGLHK